MYNYNPFKDLLRKNEYNTKEKLSKGISEILENYFSQLNLYSEKLVFEYEDIHEEYSGVIINGVWDDINRLNTNYTALNYMLPTVNSILKQDNKQEILTGNKSLRVMSEEIDIFLKVLKENSDIFFNINKTYYKQLVNLCRGTWKKGGDFSSLFAEKYKEYLPNFDSIQRNDILPGNPRDMFLGFDCELYKDGKSYGVQLKTVSSHTINNNTYEFPHIGRNYKYVSYVVFFETSVNKVFIFNDPTLFTENTLVGIYSYDAPDLI